MKGIKQTSIVVILTILLTSTPACQSVKVLPVEIPVTETGTALTAQDKLNSQHQDIADHLLIHTDMESISMQSAGLKTDDKPTAAVDSASSIQSQVLESTVWYNNKWIKMSLGGMSPVQYRKSLRLAL